MDVTARQQRRPSPPARSNAARHAIGAPAARVATRCSERASARLSRRASARRARSRASFSTIAAFASLAALLGVTTLGTVSRARAVWLPQLRLTHLGAVVIQRDGAEVIVLALSVDSGFALGESRRVSCVLPVPRGARVTRAPGSGQPFADAMTFVDRLRAGPSPTTQANTLERVPIDDSLLLEGSEAAVDALLRGELRLSGAAPPSDEALSQYRRRDWTYLIARTHPRRPPPYLLGPVVVALPADRPLIPLRLLARRPPVSIDIVLITSLQPVLDREALAARGLVYTELVDVPDEAPSAGAPPAPEDDAPLHLPFSQLAWGTLPASVRAAAAPYASGRPSMAWRDDELVHVAHVFGRLESVERWSDDLVFDVAVNAPSPTNAAPEVAPATAPPVMVDEVPTGPSTRPGCSCSIAGAEDRDRGEPTAPWVLGALVVGVAVGRSRGRRFSRDPLQAVNRR